MARAARDSGLEVAVVTRVRDHRAAIEAAGARVVPLEAERRSLNPMAAGYAAGQLAAILQGTNGPTSSTASRCGPSWSAAPRPRMAGIAAPRLRPDRPRLDRRPQRPRRPARPARPCASWCGGLRDPRSTRFLFENPDDPRLLGLDPADAGRSRSSAARASIPERCARRRCRRSRRCGSRVVARMLWSKGIDLAVEATRLARAARRAGRAVALRRARPVQPESDPGGDAARLERASPASTWHGPTRDVAGASGRATTSAACPRAAARACRARCSKAAACGRALVTTDVPGCRTLVRDGVEGLVVPPDDADGARRRAASRLAADPGGVARMGEAARARILDGFTERDVMDAVIGALPHAGAP